MTSAARAFSFCGALAMAGPALQLDPGIRDWVMIPVVLVMVLVGILRDKVPCCFCYSDASEIHLLLAVEIDPVALNTHATSVPKYPGT